MASLLGPGTASRDFMLAAASEHQCPVKGPPPSPPTNAPTQCTRVRAWGLWRAWETSRTVVVARRHLLGHERAQDGQFWGCPRVHPTRTWPGLSWKGLVPAERSEGKVPLDPRPCEANVIGQPTSGDLLREQPDPPERPRGCLWQGRGNHSWAPAPALQASSGTPKTSTA